MKTEFGGGLRQVFWTSVLVLAVATVLTSPVAAARQESHLGPTAILASRSAARLYVACADARLVLWVDLPGGEVRKRVVVPAEPTGLVESADGRRLIITCADARSAVVVLDAETGETISSLPAHHTACGPALDVRSGRLFVCNRFNNDVSLFDLSAGTELARIAVGREPVAAAVTPDGRTVLIANHLPDARTDLDYKGKVSAVVTVLDTRTLATTSVPLPHGASSVRSLCITPDGAYAFVAHLLSNFENVPFRVDMGWVNVNVVSVMDVGKRELTATIGLDELHMGAANPWSIVCSADGTTVCATAAGSHELCSIATSDLISDRARRTMSPLPGAWPVYPSLGESLWRRVALPGKGPRGVTVVGRKAYVAEYFTDTVEVVELRPDDADAVRTIALGPPPSLTVQRRGQLLFEDATLCYQSWQSCASCHPDGRADALNWDLMNDGVGNPKNTKSMLLAHATPPSMAKGVRPTAEIAVRSGLTHILFAHRPEEEAAAIDEYLKSLQPVPSPYLVNGRLGEAAERGRELFHSERVGCQRCHPAPLYTDRKTHSIGKPISSRYNNQFDTPTLVEVWRSAPYLHSGRYQTVKELLAEGRHGLGRMHGEELTEQELHDLAEYVLSL